MPATAEWTAWPRLMRVYFGSGADSAEIRARLVPWVTTLTPWLMALNVLAAVVLAARLPAAVDPWLRWTWCGAIVATWLPGLRSWIRHRARIPTRLGPGVIRRTTLHATLLAVLWSLLPWSQFPQGDPAAQMMIAGVMPSMMAGGGFVLSAVAPAGMLFALTIGLSTSAAVALYPDPMAGALASLMAGYTLIVVGAVFVGACRAVAALRSEREAERQGQLVGLLLRDFESQSADVLWEIDGRGVFSRVSPKLAALMQPDGAALGERTLLDWFEAQIPAGPGAKPLAQLRRAFGAGQSFRLRDLPVMIGGAQRWWAITARPLGDDTAPDQGWRGVITDITLEHDAQVRMEQLAQVDSLTGLANRTQLRERLQRVLEASQRKPAALLCLNMDHFKRVNDMFGHGTGDSVLREAAQRLKALVRGGDLVARAGGDEFAILLDNIQDEAHVLRFAQRVVDDLQRGFLVSAGPITGGVSVGVVAIPGHGRTVDELLANADLALGAAKKAGGSRCELFSPDMGERLRKRMTLERDLREAVARGELRLHWQPKVATADWQVTGCEALVRWQHPELGLVPPMQFISLAEETGLIVGLGEWVLQEACKVGARMLPGLTVAVNASPIQVVRDDFVQVVRRALAAGGLPATQLEIELTESLFIDASPKALRNLEALRRLGVRIALDDFGTGYSSLAYLRRFPFDTLKIDRSFVRELGTHHDARAIVRSIVDLAAALGMSTVAEGVEEPAQVELLRRAGCASVQGYLVARPMPVEQVVELLQGWGREQAPRCDDVPESIFAPLATDDLQVLH